MPKENSLLQEIGQFRRNEEMKKPKNKRVSSLRKGSEDGEEDKEEYFFNENFVQLVLENDLCFLSNEFRHIQRSSLEGPIPAGISTLTSFSDLRICDLKGKGFDFPQLSTMKSMKTLILRNCMIHGNILEYIGELKNLYCQVLNGFVDISNESLRMNSGDIPV
ncbi:hypothetical protein IFM89_014155 [Coptis chinensis]|uniref:Uncharacterized protein n=1 Tax=Coptis chinensis TaxID=261450 RepID=A0A835HUX4_9MAGN|nr:hypothetical protein IFM89_014155 [Coptis chinensis]